MEVAPLSSIYICLSIVLLYLWIRLVVLRFSIFSLIFVIQVRAALSLLLLWEIPRPKMPRLLFKILLDFDDISMGRSQGQDVQKYSLCQDVSMHTTVVLEQYMSLRTFDTELGAEGMEDIFEPKNCLVPFLLHYGPFCIQITISSNRVVLFPNIIHEGLLGECHCK